MENMTKYELMKDLPAFKKGEIFVLLGSGLHRYSDGLMAYPRVVIDKYPDILNEWFREVENEPKTWSPKVGDEYYGIDEYGGLRVNTWDNFTYELSTLAIGNVFRTRKDAEKARTWLKARKVLYDDAKGFKPDWGNPNEDKWGVYRGFWNGQLDIDRYTEVIRSPGPYFATEEDANASIRAHEKEWKIYLGVEE